MRVRRPCAGVVRARRWHGMIGPMDRAVPMTTLRATDGVTAMCWRVATQGGLVSEQFGDVDRGPSWVYRGPAARAARLAERRIAAARHLGYRDDRPGRFDAEAALAVAAAPWRDLDGAAHPAGLILAADRRTATVIMSTDRDAPVLDHEALMALGGACGELAELTIDDPMAGSQRFDPLVATVLAYRPALTRLALHHEAWCEPEDDQGSAITWLDELDPIVRGLPTLRALDLEVTVIRGARALRHAGLETLRICTGDLTLAVAPALRAAELPALTRLHLDLLAAQHVAARMGRPWQPIFTGALPALRELTIVNAPCGDAIVEDLLGGALPPALARLDLSRTALGARGAARLAAARDRLAGVAAVIVDGNPLDADAVAELHRAFGDRLEFTAAGPAGRAAAPDGPTG